MLEQLVRELIQLDVPYGGLLPPMGKARVSDAEELSQQAAQWVAKRLSYALVARITVPPGAVAVTEVVRAIRSVAERRNARGESLPDCFTIVQDHLREQIIKADRSGWSFCFWWPRKPADCEYGDDWRCPALLRQSELANTRYSRRADGLDLAEVVMELEHITKRDITDKGMVAEFPVLDIGRAVFIAGGGAGDVNDAPKLAEVMGWTAEPGRAEYEPLEGMLREMMAVLWGLPFAECDPDRPLAELCALRIIPSRYYSPEMRLGPLAAFGGFPLGAPDHSWKRTKRLRHSLARALRRKQSARQWLKGQVTGHDIAR